MKFIGIFCKKETAISEQYYIIAKKLQSFFSKTFIYSITFFPKNCLSRTRDNYMLELQDIIFEKY